MQKKIDVSIIIACYNEGPTFSQSLKQILEVLKKTGREWEIIFVEDKSLDETRETVTRLSKKIENSRAIFHKKNEGRGKSVSDGIKVARGSICGYLDVDLEISAHYIPIFIKEIENGADLVVGRRFYESGLGTIARFLASKIYAWIVRTFISTGVSDSEAGYKFFRTSKILPVLSKVKDKHWFWDTEICARATLASLKISEVPVLFVRRKEKKSTVKLIPDTIDYIKKLIKFRTQLLQELK